MRYEAYALYFDADLRPPEQAKLQIVSRRLFELSRDNVRWRLHCYESAVKANTQGRNSNGLTQGQLSGTQPLSAITPLSSLGPPTLRTLLQPGVQADHGIASNESGFAPAQSLGQRSRAAAEWDPSYETEDVDWYSEYIARNGPVSFSWMERPVTEGAKGGVQDVMGIGLYRDWSFAREDRVIAPLSDGTVCVWDMNHSHSRNASLQKGRIMGTSRPGVLVTDMSKRSDKISSRGPSLEFLNVGECVAVDSIRRRAHVSVGNVLNEVDLETLRVVHQQRFAWSIFALSQETDYSVPLTLATTLSLQIYDARLSTPDEEAEISLRCERVPPQETATSRLFNHPHSQVLQLLPNGKYPQRIRSPDPQQKGADYAPLFQPGPLYILHPPTPHVNTILLAGRFPSILCYDRRTFPKLQTAIHSGGRLCGLTSIPAPTFPVCSDSNWEVKHTIVACGEYNGRGSLELYDLDHHGPDLQHMDSSSHMQPARYQNRQSAASSKLLSVASHGTRIVFTDSSGNIKWVERDGRTPVRPHWNINTCRRQRKTTPAGDSTDDSEEVRGLFYTSDARMRNDVVRKVLPTDAYLSGDELLLWTEDRIGRLRFSNNPDEDTDDEIDQRMHDAEKMDSTGERTRRESQVADERREQEYARRLRRALEQQADEVRWMGRLGMS